MSFNINKGRVFESPDKGETIYARLPNSKLSRKRLKVRENGNVLEWTDFMLRDWDELVDKHPAIEDQLKKLKVVVELCNESR